MSGKIPIEELYSQPIVQELLSKLDESKMKDLEGVKIPYLLKDKILMSPGVWNNYFYSPSSIKDAYLRTNWNEKENRNLFLDHLDRSSREWIGEVINPRMSGENIVGDLVIIDKPTAQKLEYGAKMGISPKVHGAEEDNKMVSFLFDNFSVVINPAIKTAYINNAQVETENAISEPYGKVAYADPGYRGDKKRYPIDTEAHVRAAWSYINVPENQKPYTADQLKSIMGKIRAAATKVGITIKNEEVNKMTEKIVKHEEAEKVEPEVASPEVPVEPETTPEVPAEPEAKPAAVEPEAKPAEPVAEPAAELAAIPEPKAAVVMAEADIVGQIIKLAEMLKKPEAVPTPVAEAHSETKQEMSAMQVTIKEMSEEIVKLTTKLNEPDKATVKVEELSQADAIKMVERDPDAAFLNALQRMNTEVY